MKAISVRRPWSHLIMLDLKTIETRTWATKHRGDLLICAGKKIDRRAAKVYCRETGSIALGGHALCIVDLVDCRPMVKTDETAAMCELYDGAFAWVLENVRWVDPFPVKGQLGIFNIPLSQKELARVIRN